MTDQTMADADLSADEQAYFENRGDIGGASAAAAEPTVTPPPEDPLPVPAQADTATQPDQPQPDVDAAAEAPKKDDEPRKVDYRALKEERERRQFAEQQLANLQRQFQNVDQRLSAMQQAIQPREPQPQIPNPEEDFIGWAKWRHEQDQLREQQSIEAQRHAGARQQEAQYWGNVKGTWANLLRQNSQDDPDLEDAYNYTLTQRYRELMASGLDERSAQQQARADELQFVANHLRANQNPVTVLKQVAAARGWQPRQIEPAQQPAEKLAAVRAAQEANKSLSPIGSSGTARGSMTAQDLGNMSDDDFSKFLADKGGKGFRSVMGG